MKDPREMTPVELKTWLGERLRMRGSASAKLDLRRDEAPYERPLELWQTAGVDFHYNFLRAVLALVEDAAAEPWEPESFDHLTRLIEAGRIGEASRVLEGLAHSQALLATERGAQLHMQILRTLLATGWTGSLEFWLAQREIIGNRWPGLIFKGLARHDFAAAFRELRSLAVDKGSMRQVLDLWPGLLRDQNLSMTRLREASRRVLPQLTAESGVLLREWFALRGLDLTPVPVVIHFSLRNALVDELGDDSIPRTYAAALVSEEEPKLEYA